MSFVHALAIAATIILGAGLVALIAWEVYRHLDEIAELRMRLRDPWHVPTTVLFRDDTAIGTIHDDDWRARS